MYYGKVEISGINTSKLKVLSEKEKNELLEKVSKGDMKAREELINGNLRLVLSVIQKFTGRGESPAASAARPWGRRRRPRSQDCASCGICAR